MASETLYLPDSMERPGRSVIMSARNISKEANGQAILADVSLDIEEGKVLVLRGASGSGKSTLLHILAGYDSASSGTVMSYMDHPVRDITKLNDSSLGGWRERHVGVSPQKPELIPDMTIEDHIRDLYGLRGDNLDVDWIWSIACKMGVDEFIDRPFKKLSGGEKQRASLALALASKPRVLFADEPSSPLDSTNKGVIDKLLMSCRDYGMAVVLVSHEPQAAEMADDVVTLRDGRIVNN